MISSSTTAFALPEHLSHKADPALIGADEKHFSAVAASLRRSVAELSDRLDAERRKPGGRGQQALDRDLEIHRLSARLRALRRYRLDLCLGRMVRADDSDPVYVGRFGLTDDTGARLLLDWRSPAAAPFFGATHANPMGLTSRRRYRWTLDRVTDYWDEVFGADGLAGHAALDDQSAFIASLSASRTPRMRDVLATLQSDQDAIIRSSSRGALVVDGGPGTGKTVVALHRAAYLMYADPRLGPGSGGVLFVGPHQPYLAYVSDVLPSLGEQSVQTCTLRDLVPEGRTAPPEPHPEIARLKASAALVGAVETAVRFYEEPPTRPLVVSTPWTDVRLDADAWAEAFDAVEPGTPHNEARDRIREHLFAIVADEHDDVPTDRLRTALRRHEELNRTLDRAWPVLTAPDLVADLWSEPAYLRHCAPWLARDEVRTLQRADPYAWTTADLPFLDAARRRLGDPDASRRHRYREVVVAAQRQEMATVIDRLIEADDDGEGLVTSLRQQDLRDVLVDETGLPEADPDLLAGPFGHVVVDEAQELTDAEWQMVLSRCPSRSATIVGDRAQARRGFGESWPERLSRVGFGEVRLTSLTINYRTPEEVMTEAAPVIRAVLPDANVPTSIRRTGTPVRHGSVADLHAILDGWLATHPDGIACVVRGADTPTTAHRSPRVRALTPELSKGLEFDLVVLVDTEESGTGIEGGIEGGIVSAVDRYVAMTRATSELVVLTSS